MQYSKTPIHQLLIVELDPQADERGFFSRAWCERELAEQGVTSRCAQVSLSFNVRCGTLRGMHWQAAPHEEAKLVRVVRGAVHDVVLDRRPGSTTFGKWFATELSADNRRALFIPEGCAHGFLTLTDDAELMYFISAEFHPEAFRGLHWNSPALQGAWPFPPDVVSERDQALPDSFRDESGG